MKNKTEYEKFDDTMRGLLKVSHAEIKEKLETEKSVKNTKKRDMEPKKA